MINQYAPPTRITFITHAATREQKLGSFPADEALDHSTIVKLAALKWIGPEVQHAWAGPEIRIQQTADALGIQAVEAAALRECDYGAWRGHSLEEIHAEDFVGLTAWLTDLGAAPHGGESFYDLAIRVSTWMDESREAGHLIAVTHTSIVRAAVAYALDVPNEAFRRIEIAPLTITDLRLSGQNWHIRSVGVPLNSGSGWL